MSYRPLKVEAALGSPFVGDPNFPLDGALLYLAMAEAHGGELPVWEPGRAMPYDPRIVPLQIIENGAEWFFACSWAIWGDYVEDTDHWNKRFDVPALDMLDSKVRRVALSEGPYKAYHMPLYYRHALSITWYCVGDQDRIGALLRGMDFIGKKTSQGWGHVLRWTISQADEDYSIVDNIGRPMRAIPTSYYEGIYAEQADRGNILDLHFAQYAYRPPYWAIENQGRVVVP